MKKIDRDEVCKVLVGLSKQYPTKHNYYYYDMTCKHFTKSNAPSCLVGHALVILCPDVKRKDRETVFGQGLDPMRTGDMYFNRYRFTKGAYRLLVRAQGVADADYGSARNWSEVVDCLRLRPKS
jgi:hypothetical protein